MRKSFLHPLRKKFFVSLFLLLVCIVFFQCKPGSSVAGSKSSGIRIVMVGGGTSHDFDRWYKGTDSVTLTRDGFATVAYTSDLSTVASLLPRADVLYLSTNQNIGDPALQKAIFDFVAQGKGLVLTHAATWYNMKDWPQYNLALVGGGTRGHERYGSYDVDILKTNHPITRNISETHFTLKDELYRMKADSTGAAIQVLATATVPNTTTTYPQMWVTKSDKGRIVCLTLGHDGAAHDLPVYQQLLKNSIRWAANK